MLILLIPAGISALHKPLGNSPGFFSLYSIYILFYIYRVRNHRSRNKDRSQRDHGQFADKRERNARTIFVKNLSHRVQVRDVEEFFSCAGNIKSVRLIACNQTRQFIGIAYVEFKETGSMALVRICYLTRLLPFPTCPSDQTSNPETYYISN